MEQKLDRLLNHLGVKTDDIKVPVPPTPPVNQAPPKPPVVNNPPRRVPAPPASKKPPKVRRDKGGK